MGINDQPIRIAHLTDIHINDEAASWEGFEHCLQKVNSLSPLPQLLINGGDSVRDALKDDNETVNRQWQKFHSILSTSTNIPVEHIIGNHDVCAFESTAAAKDKVFSELKLRSAYRSFVNGNWKFILLDSTRLTEEGQWYEAGLDETQFKWLKAELEQTANNQFVCVISHIPILSACTFLDGENVKEGNWVVPGAWMHLDAGKITDLFAQFPNVKLCLSGHIHLHDVVQYNGVTYICNGAVSGNWWKGSYKQTPPGFGLVDLFADGSFSYEYLGY